MRPKYNELAREVECPQCSATVGQKCIGERGHPIEGTHWLRRRNASRLRKEKRI